MVKVPCVARHSPIAGHSVHWVDAFGRLDHTTVRASREQPDTSCILLVQLFIIVITVHLYLNGHCSGVESNLCTFALRDLRGSELRRV